VVAHYINVFVYSFKYPVHFIYAVAEDHFFRFRALCNKFHIIFHLCTQVRLIKFNTQVLIGFDKGDTHGGRHKRLKLFHCIVPFLDCLNMFMDCCISTYTVLVHLRYEISFGKELRRFGLTISHYKVRDKFFTFRYLRKDGI
jgi:hypothetical protein